MTSLDLIFQFCRYVQHEGEGEEEEEEEGGAYGDSESESEDDDLDSVSFSGERDRRDRDSTHSHDGSTHSQDSGISEEHPRLRRKPRRPDSAVPSEYSVVSDSSSLEGSEDKSFRISEVKALIVPISKPDTEVPVERNLVTPEEEASRRDKAYVIALELLNTEIHYVAILHLIDQVTFPLCRFKKIKNYLKIDKYIDSDKGCKI